MITHRVTTQIRPEPPVRFYRTIAITFLVITLALLAVVIFFTTKSAQVVIVAKSDNKNVQLAVAVAKEKAGDLSLAGTVVSKDVWHSEKYFPTGNKRVVGTATGEVTLYNDSAVSQALVKTTRLLTASGTLFRLSGPVTVPSKGQVTAQVYADKDGQDGDIGPSSFTIPGLSEDKQKVIYAKSDKAMSGGIKTIGVLTDQDLKTAEDDFVDKVKQSVAAGTATGTAMKTLVSVTDYKIISDKKSGDEVSEFNLAGTSTVVIVTYNDDELRALIEKQIAGKIDPSMEKVLSITKDPQVTLTDSDSNKGTADLSVSQDVTVTLDANADKLAASNFFNKTKDEIERYVLSLGHVVGVEVKFSPSWMHTAPSVADKLKVVVKNFD